MNVKNGIKVFIYTVILMCSITMYSTASSSAKYYKTESNVVRYSAKYKKMSADSYTWKILSSTMNNITFELSFNRSGNSRNDEYDQYEIKYNSTDFYDCSVSIDELNADDIMFYGPGEDKITAQISCNVPSNLDSNDKLVLNVTVEENIFYGSGNTEKLSYDYIKESASIKASRFLAPEGVDEDNPRIFYMPTDATDKNSKILEWLKYYDKSNYPAMEAYITDYNFSDSVIENTIPNDGTLVNLVGGITAQLVDGKYKFTITDNFNNYVSTFNDSNYFNESRKNDPMRFYFKGVEDNKNIANALFYEYLDKYYAPYVTSDQYKEVIEYFESHLDNKNVLDWSKSNILGIIYSESSSSLSIPRNDLYNNLTNKYKSSSLYLDKNSSNVLNKVYQHLFTYNFVTSTLRNSIIRSPIIQCIKTDGTPFDNYSYYIEDDLKILVHVYLEDINESQVKVGIEIERIEDDEFTLTYNVTTDSMMTDISGIESSIKSAYGDDTYDINSVINNNKVTITLTEKTQIISYSYSMADPDVIIDDNVSNESQNDVIVDTQNDNSLSTIDIDSNDHIDTNSDDDNINNIEQ